MIDIKSILTNDTMTDSYLETAIMDLANTLYFTGSAQEDLGIKEDTCKAIRQEVYSKAREQATGKTSDEMALECWVTLNNDPEDTHAFVLFDYDRGVVESK